MLSLENVSRSFKGGVEALRGVSLRIDAGSFTALLGPSGCGKSTLLRLIAGLDSPDGGRIVWDEGRPKPGRIGFVFQDATLLPWASAVQNAALPLRLRGVGKADATARATGALERVGLAGFEAARPRELSGGMRMRVSIARSLVTEPTLLLMDEPFAALDEFTRHALQVELRAIGKRIGCSVVFVTHSIYEAAFLAQRIVLMSPRPGRVASIIEARVPDGPERRSSGEYVALVAEIESRSRLASSA